MTPGEIGSLVHGTTVATNAVLESAGVRAGLLITRGFRAVYEARGWVRPDPSELLDTFFRKPPLLVPQSLTEEIPQRMDYQGDVLEPLDAPAVRAAARRLKAKGVEAVAVCYLFSFRNPAHEERTADILAEVEPSWRISLSSRVLPVIREYPRLSTTVIDAYVGPIMERYLVNLDRRLKERGITTPQVFLMQSNGGLMRITMGARFPNQTLISGPAAGVVAGTALARAGERRNLVTLDIGGTSTDISVIADGRASETSSGRIAGQDVGTPMLAVHTLGAGGGTIAWIGRDGLMKVGPQSAGAVPGPGLLRPRRHRADGDRRQPGARRARQRQRARRPHDARPRAGRAGDHGGSGAAARPRSGHRRRRHPQDRQHQHGGRPAAGVPEPRRGPAAFCLAGVRRRRSAARRLSRARPRHPGRARAAASGAHQRHGPAADRRAASLSALRSRTALVLSARTRSTPSSPICATARSRMPPRKDWTSMRCGSSSSSTCVTRTRAITSRSTARTAR